MSGAEPLAAVAAEGDRKATLEALRDVLATAIDDCPPPRDLAALSRRLLEVLSELEGLSTFDDELEHLLSMPQSGEES